MRNKLIIAMVVALLILTSFTSLAFAKPGALDTMSNVYLHSDSDDDRSESSSGDDGYQRDVDSRSADDANEDDDEIPSTSQERDANEDDDEIPSTSQERDANENDDEKDNRDGRHRDIDSRSEEGEAIEGDEEIAPTPAPTPTPDPTPAPTPDPTPAPTPDPTPAPTPDPTPIPTAPATPSGLMAVVVSNQINLAWTDNSGDETGFYIQRAIDSGFTTGLAVIGVGSNATNYIDTTAVVGTPYFYRVTAYNGAGDSGVSNIATATVPVPNPIITLPAAPSGLGATVAASQINLAWTDNSGNETGFHLQRATNSGFTAGLTTIDLGANVKTYSDTTVVAGTTYYYRVTAYNSAGDSTPSNSASGATVVPVSFSSTIQPMFDSACNSCHPTAGVSLGNYTEIRSRATNLGMGSGYLTSAQKATLAAWVTQGALDN